MIIAVMGITTLIVGILATGEAEAGSGARLVSAPVGDATSVPAGYLQFCRDNRSDCASDHEEARDVVRVEVLSDKTISMRMLFDPGHSLEERILSEQFGY